MQRLAVKLAVVLALGGCAHPPATNDQFFPPTTFGRDGAKDTFLTDWYGGHLSAMQEPPIWNLHLPQGEEIYRLLYLPTFSRPILFRVTFNGAQDPVITIKLTNGRGGYEPGILIYEQSKRLTEEELVSLIHHMEALAFLSASPAGPPEIATLDGDAFVLEGVTQGRYHAITRHSPVRLYDENLKQIGQITGQQLDFKALEDFNGKLLNVAEWMAKQFDTDATLRLRERAQQARGEDGEPAAAPTAPPEDHPSRRPPL
jgi:hypothetical protein